ncbi:hypothetical protein JCM8795_07640 [Hydrogenobaculum acidophilum]
MAVEETLIFYKDEKPFNSIVKSVYTPSIKESLITDIQDYFEKEGFKTKYLRSVSSIKNQIKKCRPVIVLLDMGNFLVSIPHYVVVTGFNGKGFFMNDGYKKDRFMSFKGFEKRFKSMGNIALVAYKEKR